MSRTPLLALLGTLAAAPAGAAQPAPVVCVSHGVSAERVAELEEAFERAARAAGVTLRPERLDGPRLLADRGRAAGLLKQAAALAAEVRYDAALARLVQAEVAANAGLAALADPRLLADLYLERGVALLLADPGAARGWLQQSFLLWPARQLREQDYPPKILGALRRAARQAARSGPIGVSGAEATRAARVLRAQRLLVVVVRPTPDGEQLTLRRFDAGTGWGGLELVDLPAGLDAQETATRLRRPLVSLLEVERAPARELVLPKPPVEPRQPLKLLPWVTGGLAVVMLATGIGLSAVAASRSSDAEALAGRTPPVEYIPTVRDLEDEGTRYRTGAIVCLTLAGVAGVVTAILALTSSRPGRVSAAPGGLRVSFGGL